MRYPKELWRGAWIVLFSTTLAACATAPPPQNVDPSTPTSTPATQTIADPLAVDDPLEDFNRRVYRFNALADRYVLLPAVHGYHLVTPHFVRTGIANFFSNLYEIDTFANTVLQAKVKGSAVTLSRFVINSTVGLAGFFDPATSLGLKQRHEDFGQTLGVYGIGSGPYLVLPFFGPSSVRDAIGLAGDQALFYILDPLQTQGSLPGRIAYFTMYAINKRNSVSFHYYQTGSPFEYTLVRLIYLNYRALQVAH